MDVHLVPSLSGKHGPLSYITTGAVRMLCGLYELTITHACCRVLSTSCCSTYKHTPVLIAA